jgi:hypothetical protein
MTQPPEITPSERPSRPRRRRGWSVRIPCGGVLLIIGLILSLLGVIIFGLIRLGPDQLEKITLLQGKPSLTPTLIPSQSSTPTQTLIATLTSTPRVLAPTSPQTEPAQPSATPYFNLPTLKGGILILSLTVRGTISLLPSARMANSWPSLPTATVTGISTYSSWPQGLLPA